MSRRRRLVGRRRCSRRKSRDMLMVERGGYWKPEEKPVGLELEGFFSMPSLSPIWGRYIWARVKEGVVRLGAGPAGMDRERPTLDMDLMGYSKTAVMSEVEVVTRVSPTAASAISSAWGRVMGRCFISSPPVSRGAR